MFEELKNSDIVSLDNFITTISTGINSIIEYTKREEVKSSLPLMIATKMVGDPIVSLARLDRAQRITMAGIDKIFNIGDILVAERPWFRHFSVYVGEGQCVENLITGVTQRSVKEFSGEELFWKFDHNLKPKYSGTEIAQRAVGKQGENQYNLVSNNCEQFVFWCATGVPISKQVDSYGSVLGNILDGGEVYYRF